MDEGTRLRPDWFVHVERVIRSLTRAYRRWPDYPDLCQECWRAVLERLPDWRPAECKIETWAYHVSRGAIGAWIGRHAADRRRCRRYAEGRERSTRAPDPWAVHAVRLAVSDLPETQRRIVRHLFWDGLSLADTARVMDRPYGGVHHQATRATRQLREDLGDYTAFGGPLRTSLAIDSRPVPRRCRRKPQKEPD